MLYHKSFGYETCELLLYAVHKKYDANAEETLDYGIEFHESMCCTPEEHNEIVKATKNKFDEGFINMSRKHVIGCGNLFWPAMSCNTKVIFIHALKLLDFFGTSFFEKYGHAQPSTPSQMMFMLRYKGDHKFPQSIKVSMTTWRDIIFKTHNFVWIDNNELARIVIQSAQNYGYIVDECKMKNVPDGLSDVCIVCYA